MQCVDFLHYMQFSRPCQCLFTRYSQKKGCFLMPFSPEIACFSPVSHMLPCAFLVSFGFVLDTEIIKNTNRFAASGAGACKKGKEGKLEGEPLTAPSAEGAFSLGGAPCKASPERGGARRRRAKGFVPKHRKVAAALSAAVTITPKQENAPAYHGRTSQKESASLFPAALRERGSGGEALLSEKRPLPQRSSHHRPHYVLSTPCVVEGADAAHLVDA